MSHKTKSTQTKLSLYNDINPRLFSISLQVWIEVNDPDTDSQGKKK